jgi:hypothetical protein
MMIYPLIIQQSEGHSFSLLHVLTGEMFYVWTNISACFFVFFLPLFPLSTGIPEIPKRRLIFFFILHRNRQQKTPKEKKNQLIDPLFIIVPAYIRAISHSDSCVSLVTTKKMTQIIIIIIKKGKSIQRFRIERFQWFPSIDGRGGDCTNKVRLDLFSSFFPFC